MIDFSGKAALVTGASRGIGRAIAEKLAASGASVVLAARTLEAAKSVADAISEKGGVAKAVACDVASFAEVQAAVTLALQSYGSLDILVNNAGVIDPITKLAESDPDEWGRAIDVNVKGVYHGMRVALPIMTEQGSGTIVNLSSGAAESALEGWSHYASSKAAVKRLTACADREVAELGIRVVGLSPGTVATDMMAQIKQSGINPVSQLDWSTHIPPEWVGDAVVFLCGPGGAAFAGTDFTLKTDEGRKLVGLPPVGA